MEYYEYKVIEIGKGGGLFKVAPDIDILADALNKFGSQGWELVSCITTACHEGETRSAIAIFKRRVK